MICYDLPFLIHFYIISCSDSHSYMIVLLNGHHSFTHSTLILHYDHGVKLSG
jgi:hypothetical protein